MYTWRFVTAETVFDRALPLIRGMRIDLISEMERPTVCSNRLRIADRFL